MTCRTMIPFHVLIGFVALTVAAAPVMMMSCGMVFWMFVAVFALQSALAALLVSSHLRRLRRSGVPKNAWRGDM